MEKDLMLYQPIITDIKEIISAGQQNAYNAVNIAMVLTYWHIGKRIVEQEQEGSERAEYGKRLISVLSEELKKIWQKLLRTKSAIFQKILFVLSRRADCEHACSQSQLVAFQKPFACAGRRRKNVVYE